MEHWKTILERKEEAMKSKTLKRCIAIMLCMVIVLSGSGYLLAESLQEGTAEIGTEVQSEEGTAEDEQQRMNSRLLMKEPWK